jgi:hypothetical protein
MLNTKSLSHVPASLASQHHILVSSLSIVHAAAKAPFLLSAFVCELE